MEVALKTEDFSLVLFLDFNCMLWFLTYTEEKGEEGAGLASNLWGRTKFLSIRRERHLVSLRMGSQAADAEPWRGRGGGASSWTDGTQCLLQIPLQSGAGHGPEPIFLPP